MSGRTGWPGLPLGVATQDISGSSRAISEPRRLKAALGADRFVLRNWEIGLFIAPT